MQVDETSGGVVAFDRFWRWLKGHPNCILQAGTPHAAIYDHDLMHWALSEDEHHTPILQLILGKALMAELVLDAANILFVQAMPDPDAPDGQVVFEMMAGSAEEPVAVFHVRMAHGMDEEEAHHNLDAH